MPSDPRVTFTLIESGTTYATAPDPARATVGCAVCESWDHTPSECPRRERAVLIDRSLRDGDQALPTVNDEVDCQTRLMNRISQEVPARRELGIKRYGTALQPFNGRRSTRDLWEELLDASTYFMQVEAEYEALVDHLLAIVLAETVDESSEWTASAALLLLKLGRWDGERGAACTT